MLEEKIMKVKIDSNYLIFPVGTISTPKELIFSNNKNSVYSIVIKLDNYAPDFYAYIDVSRFKGQTLELLVEPDMELCFRTADTADIENLYNEPLRPQVHFTAKNGFINDPNGLIYIDGIYHMFFQYNPGDVHWRKSKHWGHAVSNDLIHWKEDKIALFPDERGAMFSGSAVLDENNVLGKNTDGQKTAVLFYTTTEPYAQNMSYSTDNFKTINHYKKNPIIPFIDDRNRDPKVVYCDELGSYIMILYITENMYYIFTSDNLTDWVLLQSINMTAERECPDIFPINDKEGNRRWVIMGASDKYLVGKFENGKFVPVQDIMSLHYGISAYAGQSFSNLPSGRIVRMVWNRWRIKPNSFSGQMGIPMELSLVRFNDTYYLETNPVEELKTIYKDINHSENVEISPESKFNAKLENSPCLIKIKSDYISSGSSSLSIFGRDITIDFSKNILKLGDYTMPVSITKSLLDITILIDRCSMEIFTDNGKAYMSCLTDYASMDRNIPYLTLSADSKQVISTIEIISLNSIWEQDISFYKPFLLRKN